MTLALFHIIQHLLEHNPWLARIFMNCCRAERIRDILLPAGENLAVAPSSIVLSALEQKLSHGTPLSTVGTASEVYHHLRLLWARLGTVHCPKCGEPGQVVNAADELAPLALAVRVEDVHHALVRRENLPGCVRIVRRRNRFGKRH